MTTLIDLIFKGNFVNTDLSFIKECVLQSKNMYFNSPENIYVNTFDEIIKIIESNNYIDFVISADLIKLDKISIPNVFINIGRDDQDIEILFFFDLKDLKGNFQESLDYLYNWSIFFKNKYHFKNFMCQSDGTNFDREYYFTSE